MTKGGERAAQSVVGCGDVPLALLCGQHPPPLLDSCDTSIGFSLLFGRMVPVAKYG
jgi:hypothetical protein